MKRSLARIPHGIIEYSRGVEDTVSISIRTRGEILARRLADIMCNVKNISVPYFALDVSYWRDDREKPYPLLMEFLPVEDKEVILVDDALFKGRTIWATMDAAMHYGRARGTQLAVLVDHGRRELPIRADYTGKNTPSSLREVAWVRVGETDGNDGASIGK